MFFIYSDKHLYNCNCYSLIYLLILSILFAYSAIAFDYVILKRLKENVKF